MSIEQRTNMKFTESTETHQMMKKVYGDDCLSRSRIHECFKRFQEGREAVVNEENAEIEREFIRRD